MNKSDIYTLSSIIVGYFLSINKNALEQNALGNWFMTVGQILETNAAYQQLYNIKPIQEKKFTINDKDDIISFINELQETFEQIKKEL